MIIRKLIGNLSCPHCASVIDPKTYKEAKNIQACPSCNKTIQFKQALGRNIAVGFGGLVVGAAIGTFLFGQGQITHLGAVILGAFSFFRFGKFGYEKAE